MPIRVLLRSLLIVCCAGLALPPQSVGAQAPLDAVAWFQGCWERAGANGRRTVERWHAPTGAGMKGWSRSFADTVEVAGERLRIGTVDGVLTYFAHPSTQAPQEFKAKAVTADEAVFENPAHDFPQRIVYVRRGADSLVARIEGDRAGRRQPVTFGFRRIDCAGQGEPAVDVAEEALRPYYHDLETRIRAHPQGMSGWFVQHAAPTFAYVNFSGAGYMARLGSLRTQENVVRNLAGNTSPLPPEYAAHVRVATILARGDTAEVMVVTSQSARVGTGEASRVRSAELRRLDRWVRQGASWKLHGALLVGDESYLDGKLQVRDGVPVP